MNPVILVMSGGAIGAALRYGLSRALPVNLGGWPWPTFAANLLGGLAMGMLAAWLVRGNGAAEPLRLFLGVGVLGGFTTFIPFSLEMAPTVQWGHVYDPELAQAWLLRAMLHTPDAIGRMAPADQKQAIDDMWASYAQFWKAMNLCPQAWGRYRKAWEYYARPATPPPVAQGAERGIAAEDPAARRGVVGHVDDLPVPQLVQAREEVRADEAGVQFGHAVDVMRADDREVRHADAFRETPLDDREPRLAGIGPRPAPPAVPEIARGVHADDPQVGWGAL